MKINWFGSGLVRPEERSIFPPTMAISDPAIVEWLGWGGNATSAGVSVNEQSAMGLAAVYRSVAIIAGTIGGLPLKTYRNIDEDTRQRVTSFLDEPDGPDGMTPFEWTELSLVHALLWGNTFYQNVYGGAGQLLALHPIHPAAVTVKPVLSADEQRKYGPYMKYFTVALADGTSRDFSPADITHVPALGYDGLKGLSVIEAHRQAIGTGLAGEQAAARMFANGLLLGGLVSADEDLAEEDAKAALEGIKAKLAGAKHAGDVAMVNARLKFTPWTMPATDAQFIESRVHQVTEVARIFGIPKQLLMEDGASTWGSGVAELLRWMARTTLMPWTTRFEQRLSRLLAKPRFVEFDYSGLLQPAPEVEIPLLISQVEAGLITVNEARKIRNMPPLEETSNGSNQEVNGSAGADAAAGVGVGAQDPQPA